MVSSVLISGTVGILRKGDRIQWPSLGDNGLWCQRLRLNSQTILSRSRNDRVTLMLKIRYIKLLEDLKRPHPCKQFEGRISAITNNQITQKEI